MNPGVRNEQRLQLAVSMAGMGLMEIDYHSDTLVADGRAAELFEIPVGIRVARQDLHAKFHPEDREHVECLIAESLHPHSSGEFEVECRILHSNGSVHWLNIRKRITFDKQMRASSGLMAVIDITPHKVAEATLRQRATEIERANAQLQEALIEQQRAKMVAEAANRSRGEFLANMSHEILTPMAAILGHADILKEHLQDPDNVTLVQTIRRNGAFLIEILNDIMDISKIDAGMLVIDRVTVQPVPLIADIGLLMEVRASEKKLPLEVAYAGPIPSTIETDPVRLRQILLNLLGNAIKFTTAGKVQLVVAFNAVERQLQFDVIDTGIGIQSQDCERLFEPFVQSDNTSTRSFGGTGLGLTISRRLARALGGDVTVQSEFGSGSRFTLLIDAGRTGELIEPNLDDRNRTSVAFEEVELYGTVLVVDDRRDIRYLAQHFIEKAGAIVVTATNGQEAIEYLCSEDCVDVDVIVMDMQMPIMDGYTASKELRKRGCKLPIIALTANAMKSDREECLAAGCSDYTTKPLDRQQLVSMIARWMN